MKQDLKNRHDIKTRFRNRNNNRHSQNLVAYFINKASQGLATLESFPRVWMAETHDNKNSVVLTGRCSRCARRTATSRRHVQSVIRFFNTLHNGRGQCDFAVLGDVVSSPCLHFYPALHSETVRYELVIDNDRHVTPGRKMEVCPTIPCQSPSRSSTFIRSRMSQIGRKLLLLQQGGPTCT
jgi:hypothetical protein